MNYYQLTHNLQRRFRNNRKCALCGQLISNTDFIVYKESYYGKFKIYNFFHRRCVLNEQKISTVKGKE